MLSKGDRTSDALVSMARTVLGTEFVTPIMSCFGGGAHGIEQAARAIAGRLIPQLPARRRFHRTLLIWAGPSPLGQSGGPFRAVGMAGGWRRQNPHDNDTPKLKMRLAIAISN